MNEVHSHDGGRSEIELMIGNRNIGYYLHQFARFDALGQGLHVSWNWPAFLLGGIWALYRKMYGWFFALWFATAISNAIGSGGNPKQAAIGGFVLLGSLAIFGVYANALYYRHLQRKLAIAKFEIKDDEARLARVVSKGGVNAWVPWLGLVAVAGIVLAIAIPMFATRKDAKPWDKYQTSSQPTPAPELKPYSGDYTPLPEQPKSSEQIWNEKASAFMSAHPDIGSDQEKAKIMQDMVNRVEAANPGIDDDLLLESAYYHTTEQIKANQEALQNQQAAALQEQTKLATEAAAAGTLPAQQYANGPCPDGLVHDPAFGGACNEPEAVMANAEQREKAASSR